MKNIFRILLLAAFFSTNYKQALAQLASGDAFLQGKYVEVGVAPNGNYGSRFNAPSGYHGRSSSSDLLIPAAIGFIADPDKDGWGVGTPTFVGDYFMPANPWIGWGIEIDGTRYLANRQTSAITFSAGLTGSNTDYFITGKLKHTSWTGTAGDISIHQDTYLDTNSLYFVSKLKLKNTGSSTALNIYYLQTVNPDNDYANFASNLNTKDTIVFQNPNVENKALIVARGSSSNSYLGLGTKDCRAQVFRGPLNNTDITLTSSFASVYDFTRPSHNFSGGFPSGNSSIGIIFKIDSLKAGDSTVFAYTYILGQAYLDSAFLQIKSNFLYSGVQYNSGDTLSACPGAVLPVSIQNGESFNYTWTPVSGLATTSGYANSITVGTSTVTYRAVGTGIYSNCTNNDTLYLNIKPISLPAAPIVSTPINFCVGGPSATLTATGTNLKWYTASSGATALASAPSIITGTASTATYYVSQSLSAASGGCEGTLRAAIVANVNALPAAPTVTTPVNLCVGGPSATLTATGTNLKWYTVASGGSPLASAPVISTASASAATYYVSQSLSASSGGCEGTSRAAIVVNVNALPTAPTVTSPVNLCVGGPGATLTATGTNLNWYTASSGGTALASAPTITTGTASTATYYVSQSLSAASGGCEGTLRAAIVANVNDLPAAPTVSTPVNLCVGGPGTTLTATGTNLKWYIAPSGGTPLASAPSITTGTASTATYYVSQSLAAASGGCEGTARATMVATVNALPLAPTVSTPINLCIGGADSTLTAIGANLKWYTMATGGVGLLTAPKITPSSTGSSTYYVSSSLALSSGACEGARATISVNVQPLPTLLISPVGVPDFVYCDSRSVKLLGTSPTAVSYQWAFEGVSIPTATMDTLSAGKSGYFSLMVKNVFGCIRIDSVLVKPTPFPTPILSPTEVQMCDGTDIMLYSSPAAAGYTYQWFKDGLPMGIPLIETKTPVSLTGNYQVIITDIYTCVKSTNLSSVSTYAPVPKPIVLRTGTLLTLDKPYTKYQWYRNNKIIAGATMRNYTMAVDGAYYAKVWDVNGCENHSDTLQSNALAINGLKSSNVSIRIYPNPTVDLLFIETPVNVKATVCDALGRKLLEVRNASSISLKNLADAMYILYLHDDDGSLIGSYKILKTEK